MNKLKTNFKINLLIMVGLSLALGGFFGIAFNQLDIVLNSDPGDWNLKVLYMISLATLLLFFVIKILIDSLAATINKLIKIKREMLENEITRTIK